MTELDYWSIKQQCLVPFTDSGVLGDNEGISINCFHKKYHDKWGHLVKILEQEYEVARTPVVITSYKKQSDQPELVIQMVFNSADSDKFFVFMIAKLAVLASGAFVEYHWSKDALNLKLTLKGFDDR